MSTQIQSLLWWSHGNTLNNKTQNLGQAQSLAIPPTHLSETQRFSSIKNSYALKRKMLYDRRCSGSKVVNFPVNPTTAELRGIGEYIFQDHAWISDDSLMVCARQCTCSDIVRCKCERDTRREKRDFVCLSFIALFSLLMINVTVEIAR